MNLDFLTADRLVDAVRFFAFVFSVVVHENAHGVTANHFGDPTARDMGRITMNPIPHVDPIGSVLLPLVSLYTGVRLIGWAKPVPVNSANLRNPVVDNAYVAIAGPLSNFLLAFAAAILWIIVEVAFAHVPALAAHGERSHMFFNTLCFCFIEVNCTLAIFNLLPIPPLDGHWILMRYLPPAPREALASIGPWGFFILLGLMWTGILGRIINPPIVLVIWFYHLLVQSVAKLF